jgi:uncharacterized repeat protein (TIGR01451 family)
MRLLYLAVILLLVSGAYAKESDDENDISFNDFTLNIGDSIDISSYRAELIEIQSIRDGIVVMRVFKPGGELDEQRALLQSSSNSFDGGPEKGGIALTVIDIFDEQSAKVRVEYKKSLGTPKKRTSDRPRAAADLPNLMVQKSFEKSALSVGDDVKATVTVKNVGTGSASEIVVEDLPPLPEFSYIAGYPPKIKSGLEPGESDSAIYIMNAVKDGSVRVPAIEVRYQDSKKNAKSNTSAPFDIVINPKGKPDLEVSLGSSSPIPEGGEGTLNVSLLNQGKVSATRIEVTADIKPSEGLEANGLERAFFEIAPGGKESYSVKLIGERAGNYSINLKASFQDGDAAMIRDGRTEVVVLEREYKYLYYILIIPVIIIAVLMYRRYREYKY